MGGLRAWDDAKSGGQANARTSMAQEGSCSVLHPIAVGKRGQWRKRRRSL
jgi:hypothetical protein